MVKPVCTKCRASASITMHCTSDGQAVYLTSLRSFAPFKHGRSLCVPKVYRFTLSGIPSVSGAKRRRGMMHCVVVLSDVPGCFEPRCVVRFCVMLFCVVLSCLVPFCVVLCCAVLFCIV